MTLTLMVLTLALVGSAAFPDGQGPAAASPARQKQQTVLFMCPHGAAKSVLASAYFRQLARERGLDVRVEAAGTDPDPTIAPAVAAHLRRQGHAMPDAAPRKATADDLARADVVVSLGCDLSGLPKPRGTLHRWDDVPSPSADFAAADAAIRARVIALVEELVRDARR